MLIFSYAYVDDVLVHAPDQPDTPLAKEILDNLAKFPHCILLTRVGQFYEVCTLWSFRLLGARLTLSFQVVLYASR